MAVFWLGAVALMQHSVIQFQKTFSNLTSYGKFSAHPNYKLLGPVYSTYYAARVVAWTYVSYRMTKLLLAMIRRHYQGLDDLHYFWYYDTNFPDMLHDEEDMRYINFRYTDAKVVPDAMTGYYPNEDLKYGKFLNKKGREYLPA